MHTLFATFFLLVFSFSHNAALRHSEARSDMASPSRYRMDYTPTHRELARAGFLSAGYAGSACVSCRRMNTTFKLR